MAGIDPATEIPPLGLLPSRQRWRPPFTYTPADIDALMRQARESIGSPLLAETFETLIGFLAVTGMRIGEVIHLDRGDVDLAAGCLTVRNAKFGNYGKPAIMPSSASNRLSRNGFGSGSSA